MGKDPGKGVEEQAGWDSRKHGLKLIWGRLVNGIPFSQTKDRYLGDESIDWLHRPGQAWIGLDPMDSTDR